MWKWVMSPVKKYHPVKTGLTWCETETWNVNTVLEPVNPIMTIFLSHVFINKNDILITLDGQDKVSCEFKDSDVY